MKNHRIINYALGLFVFIFALSLGHWIGNGEFFGPSIVEAKTAQSTVVFDRANPAIQAVMAIQDRRNPELMAIPGVIGTGTGLTEDGRPAIVVYTMHPLQTIPPVIEHVPVIQEVTGMFIAFSDPTAWFPRPVPTGVSTGHPDITAGTIGCRVIDGQGNVYALSNNHV